MNCYLAIDIGASSGRHIVCTEKNGKLEFNEVYRFPNGMKKVNGSLVWNIDELEKEVKKGLKVCFEKGFTPDSLGIDTWAVDYVLLDKDGTPIKPCYAYRDARTKGVINEMPLDFGYLYSRTGIQHQDFNSVYQLWCDKKSGRMDKAEHFLMIPDYLAYKLTGVMSNEYTNSTTTGLFNAEKKEWDEEIISKLGYKKSLFSKPLLPANKIGHFSESVKNEVGFDTVVVTSPTHDTASAVAACPLDENMAYLSSGTWSLIGVENMIPVLSEKSKKANFTNEGGVEYRFRYLKNIMGTWLFGNVEKLFSKKNSFDDRMYMAMESKYDGIFDPNSEVLSAPENMFEEIKKLLHDDSLSEADIYRSIYRSLASSYDKAIKEIESITGKNITGLLIVGGGSKDDYLTHLTAEFTGKKVVRGMTEATSAGNIAAQIMYSEGLTLSEVRKIIKKSFDFEEIVK